MAFKQALLLLLCMAVCILAAPVDQTNIDRSLTAGPNAFHQAVKPILNYFICLPLLIVFLAIIPLNYIQLKVRALPGMAAQVQRSEAARLEMVRQIEIDNAKTLIERRLGETGVTQANIDHF